jgi:hypothetical protein
VSVSSETFTSSRDRSVVMANDLAVLCLASLCDSLNTSLLALRLAALLRFFRWVSGFGTKTGMLSVNIYDVAGIAHLAHYSSFVAHHQYPN